MSWNKELGSGLSNARQNHLGCLAAARFIADSLRIKSGEEPLSEYELALSESILNSAWNENELSLDEIGDFEFELYGELFKMSPKDRKIIIKYDIPKVIATAAANAGVELVRGEIPVETVIDISGLSVNVTQGYQKQGVFTFPAESPM